MSDVQSVIVQIRAASPGDAGQITTGFYVVQDGVLTMTSPDGIPVNAALYRHTLAPADNEKRIAAVLTKQIRMQMMGETVPGFTRALRYSSAGVV